MEIGLGCGRPSAGPEADQDGGSGERGGIYAEGRPGPDEGDRDSPDGRSGHQRHPEGGLHDRGSQGIAIAAKYVGQDRGPGGLKRRLRRRGQVEQADQAGHRCPWDQHRSDQERPDHVAGDHHLPPRQPVPEAGDEQAADDPGQVARRVGQGGQQR